MTNETYTAEEIAKYLKVHPYTVKRLGRAGKILGFSAIGGSASAIRIGGCVNVCGANLCGGKVGDQWRFDVKEIEEWRRNQGKRNSTKKAIKNLEELNY